MNQLNNEICKYWFGKDYAGAFAKRTLKIGYDINHKEIKDGHKEEMHLFRK